MTNDLWITKYEPRTLDEYVGHKDLVDLFKKYVKLGFIPNVTLGGFPGAGKTLLVKCFANDLGITNVPGQFQLIDASTDRGINMIRTTLKDMAEKPTLDGEPKLICLDEGDGVTGDAQGAMRGLIQRCASNARFILTGNYPEEFIEAINSRCPLKIFPPFTKEDITTMIKRIQDVEKFTITQDAIDALYQVSKGDMRLMINTLQDASIMSDGKIEKKHITINEVDINEAKQIILIAQSDFSQARELLTTILQNKGAAQILHKIYDATYFVPLSKDSNENEIMQSRLRDRIAEIDFRLTQGTNTQLQLDYILNYIRLLKYIPLQCPKVS